MRHLDLLNQFLSLRFTQPGHPDCLARHGYLVEAIGVTISLGADAKVAPDVVALQPERQLTLLVEVKGGRSVDMQQLRRMLSVTAEDLRDRAHLHVPDPAKHHVHVVYFCNEEHAADTAEELAGKPTTVIGFDGASYSLAGAALPDEDLASCLRDATITGHAALDIVPFDQESPIAEVARTVLPHVVDAWVKGSGPLRPDLLVSRTHHMVRPAMESTGSGSELARIQRQVRDVLDDLTNNELAPWLNKVRSSPPGWRFRKSLPTDSSRTRELQKLARAAQRYLDRVGNDRGIQLTLDYAEDDEDGPGAG